MILSVGREYLRRVHKYIEKVTDFKIVAALCRDSERMNSTKRWEIRSLPKNHQCGQFCLNTDDQPQKQTAQQTEESETSKQQNDQIVSSNNATHENATEDVNNTNSTEIRDKEPKSFESIQNEFYQVMGDNFARILMKRFRKEKLDKEETEWLNRWNSEEAVHYGWMGIYCHDGENVKDLTKRISTLIEEKQ